MTPQLNIINFDAFIKKALLTESTREPVVDSAEDFRDALMLAVLASELLDLYKKHAFYGKPLDPHARAEVLEKIIAVATGTIDPIRHEGVEAALNINARLLHAVVGKFTEAGEMLQALGESEETGELDLVNLAEEAGDDKWYDAILLDELRRLHPSLTLANILQTNNDKLLKKRYPNGFTGEAAIFRDVAEERLVLETIVEKH